MLKIVKDSFIHNDRYILKIHVNGHSSAGNTGCYIMSSNAVMTADNLTAGGCFAAYTRNKFSITGKSVVIEHAGIYFDRTVYSEISHTMPGDLSYIDGCSNTNIVPPPRNGDPCINYLYFPPGIMQTSHTHPSIRIGCVLSGRGKAHLSGITTELNVGDIFLLERHTLHNFSTDADNSMSLVVFHPDSDAGPTDEFNPMKTRTYIQK